MTDGEQEFVSRYAVSRETMDRLRLYAELLEKWSRKINLISPSTVPHLWSRHFHDSAQLARMAPGKVFHWADLGSGAGFPGLVIAALDADTGNIDQITLVESDQRKSAFLRTVARELGLKVRVLAKRIEDVDPLCASVLSARALADLPALLHFADRHIEKDGVALFPKGRQYRKELRDALENWRFDCETVSSETDPDAVVLKISEIRRA